MTRIMQLRGLLHFESILFESIEFLLKYLIFYSWYIILVESRVDILCFQPQNISKTIIWLIVVRFVSQIQKCVFLEKNTLYLHSDFSAFIRFFQLLITTTKCKWYILFIPI